MTGIELRPLSLGEILDRTFSLYRRYFLLFIGIAGIPQIPVYVVQVMQSGLQQKLFGRAGSSPLVSIGVTIIFAIVGLIAYLLSQGGTVLAISDLYLGRPISVDEALRRVRGHLGFLFGVIVLNGLAITGGFILLVIPGLYIACRLLVCVPCALIEERGPRDSLTRSWELTKGFAGRAFMIFLLYVVIALAATTLLAMPFSFGMLHALKDPGTMWFWLALTELGARLASILTQPVLLIATAIFYYDLRVRKEAFDLQFLMNPNAPPPSGPSSVPSIL